MPQNINLCVGCDLFDNMCIRDKKCTRRYYNDSQCEECGAVFDLDNLSDDNVILQREGMTEFWGAVVALPDSVKGFICPECGHINI